MGLHDEIGNPFLGGVQRFNVARGGCAEYGMWQGTICTFGSQESIEGITL